MVKLCWNHHNWGDCYNFVGGPRNKGENSREQVSHPPNRSSWNSTELCTVVLEKVMYHVGRGYDVLLELHLTLQALLKLMFYASQWWLTCYYLFVAKNGTSKSWTYHWKLKLRTLICLLWLLLFISLIYLNIVLM